MTTRQAACSCGQLTATCEGDPVRVSVCHCLNCQRRSGSAFAAQARWPKAQVRTAGASTEYVRAGDSGDKARFHFCPVCGTTVYYSIEAMPDVIAVALGAFADPKFPDARVSVYEERKHRWVSITGDDVEHCD